jgi:hypothetical protein
MNLFIHVIRDASLPTIQSDLALMSTLSKSIYTPLTKEPASYAEATLLAGLTTTIFLYRMLVQILSS